MRSFPETDIDPKIVRKIKDTNGSFLTSYIAHTGQNVILCLLFRDMLISIQFLRSLFAIIFLY